MAINYTNVAISYHKKFNWNVIPCDGKRGMIKWKEFQDKSIPEENIRSWWSNDPSANIGLIVGINSDVIVLDIDQPECFNHRNLDIPLTPKVLTGGRGEHHYFMHPELNGKFIKNHKELDQTNSKEIFSIRCKNQLVLLPPSIHPDSKNPYIWADEYEPWNINFADPPKWIIDLILKDPKEEIKRNNQYSQIDTSSKDIINEIKSKTSFSDVLIHDFGFQCTRYSDYITFDCPFHEDGEHHGFAVWDSICGAHDFHDESSYDVISFVQSYKKCSFAESLEFLAGRIGLDISSFDTRESNFRNMTERIIKFIEDQDIELFHDEHKQPYAKFKINGSQTLMRIDSKDFKNYLNMIFWDKEHRALRSENVNSAISLLEARAIFEGKCYKLHTRVAWVDENIFYDLSDDLAVRINKDGWEIINDPPILFRRYSVQETQVIPEHADIDTIFLIFNYVNIQDQELQLLYITNLLISIIPDIPHPIDIFYGEGGSCKSTASKIKKSLIDPASVDFSSNISSIQELIQQASHHLHLILDNLSYLSPQLSDLLCRLVTGEGYSKRRLYTDDEDVIYSLKRSISISSTSNVVTKSDLIDRSISFELKTISDDERMDEIKLWKEFNELKPKLLGSIFTLLSKAMMNYESINLKEKPRMADFATWGCSIAKSLGKSEDDFIRAYKYNRQTHSREVIDTNPLAELLFIFMKERHEWTGNATSLLSELNMLAAKHDIDTDVKAYPKGHNWLWKRLIDLNPILKTTGINISKDDTSRNIGGRKIIIKKIGSYETNSSNKD